MQKVQERFRMQNQAIVHALPAVATITSAMDAPVMCAKRWSNLENPSIASSVRNVATLHIWSVLWKQDLQDVYLIVALIVSIGVRAVVQR